MSGQLALGLRLRDGSSFENFLPGPNREALEAVRAAKATAAVYLWGEAATGKTHLLEAACRQAQAEGRAPAYVPLRDKGALSPAMLEDLDTALVCLDDLEAIAGDAAWERALFRLWESRRGQPGALLMTAAVPPARLGFQLPDLMTRLASASVYALKPLDDDGKIEALRLRARHRGFDLGEEVARYMLNRYPRDLGSMFALLERIDAASLAQQRRVTIPFLRTLEDH
jgi:DnaA family protein